MFFRRAALFIADKLPDGIDDVPLLVLIGVDKMQSVYPALVRLST